MALKHVLLIATSLLLVAAGADLGLRSVPFSWSQSVGALFALALFLSVLAYFYAVLIWRGILLAAAIGTFVVGLLVGDWTFKVGGSIPGISF